MKSTTLILSILLSCKIGAQTNSIALNENTLSYIDENYYSSNFLTNNLFFEQNTQLPELTAHLYNNENVIDFPHTNFTLPPPLLTTNPHALEICAGNSTKLTAQSNATIFWYTTPPPIGNPVGTGSIYITPQLGTGYYTYYAVAENNGIRSDVTAMEVVMVYPNPTLTITSSVNQLCTNETATLTVSGTTYYEWENGPVSAHITIRPIITQSFKVTGINTAGCTSTAIYTQSVTSCKSNNTNENKLSNINEINLGERLFSIYPNPTSGEFNVSVNTISENTHIEIYNSLGSLTYSGKLANEVSSINLKNYSNGIYIVRIIENNTVLKQEKIIKE